MLRKTMMLLLTLALMLSGTGSGFAQDTAPATPNDENAAQSVYLPLVQASQQITAETTLTGTTDTTDTAEAAGWVVIAMTAVAKVAAVTGGGRSAASLRSLG